MPVSAAVASSPREIKAKSNARDMRTREQSNMTKPHTRTETKNIENDPMQSKHGRPGA